MKRTKLALSVGQALAMIGVGLLGYSAQGFAQAAADAPAASSTTAVPPAPGTAQKPDEKKVTDLNTVTVTGQLAALQRAQAIKKDSVNTVDSISAEETGKFPDPNVADALQRVPR